MVIYVNKDKIKENEHKLIYFNDFIPMDIKYYIDTHKRNEYLKRIGKLDKIKKEEFKIRTNAKSSEDADLYFENVLIDWIKKNPQFKDCFIFE